MVIKQLEEMGMVLTIKAIKTILILTIGGILYQHLFAENPDYMQPLSIFYWSSISAISFWLAGLFDKPVPHKG